MAMPAAMKNRAILKIRFLIGLGIKRVDLCGRVYHFSAD
jgi:hypothetical protein